MLNWANQFNICALLDNHNYNFGHHSVECLLAVGAVTSFEVNERAVAELKNYLANTHDWLFGHVGYGFRNHLFGTVSKHESPISFADAFFFQPATVIELRDGEAKISCFNSHPAETLNQITNTQTPSSKPQTPNSKLSIHPKISKQAYLQTINQLRQHILRGDCYEINFCQEFFAENTQIEVLSVYETLSAISPNPFSCFYKVNNDYLLCASPERYIKKVGSKIISQPIKGTSKRSLSNQQEDLQLKNQLINSQKDRSENVMVVDLVRNDLSKVCKEGSVQVDELFGIYSFPQVHQMVSTISGELLDDTGLVDVLKASFPMGSMTGAPKKKVMELTEQYEQSKRGIYSGCVGYITPEKDYDFNVVIRSIMYNQDAQYLSYQVGGGITFYSNAEQEYEECLLKAEAIKKVLQ